MKKETRLDKQGQSTKENTEILLSSLDDMVCSLKKINREINALVQAAAPKGYGCCSFECRRLSPKAATCYDLANRILFLIDKKEQIRCLLTAVRQALFSIESKRVAYALYLRYQKGLICDECAALMRISTRHFYRLLNAGLEAVAQQLLQDERGKLALEKGVDNFLHRYGK